MWRPATKQITGTNEVPLGQRRRFGPAPTEDAAPPQLAQPSPSAYPRPVQQDPDSPTRGRDESPINGGAVGKLNLKIALDSISPSLASFEFDSSTRDFSQLTSAYMSSLTTSCHYTNTDHDTNPNMLLFLIHSQLTPMLLAKGVAAGVMLKLTSLACPLLFLPRVFPRLSLTTTQFISVWKKLTAN